MSPPQQRDARDVLVDLRLHLERLARHRPVVTGMVRNAQEVANPLERRPAVGEVVLVEPVARIVPLEALDERRVEVERDAELVTDGAHEELLVAGRVAAFARKLLAISDEKVFDATSNIEVVNAGQQGFEPFEGPHGHGASIRERAGCDRSDAELHEEAVRALAAGLVPEFVEAQHVPRRVSGRTFADLV
jgi:hypothetical protein